jgi:hypothetical protein
MKKPTILLFCLISFVVQAQEKKDTTAKAKALFALTNIYKDYTKECYKDSVLVNCFIILESDGKSAKSDTLCGVGLMLFDYGGAAPVPLRAKNSYWVHAPATNDGFMKWLKIKEVKK